MSLDVVDAVAVRDAEAAISDYEARHLKLWLATSMPATAQDAEAWRAALRRWVTAHKQSLAILELRLSSQSGDADAYAIRAASTDLRIAAPTARLAIAGDTVANPIPRLLTRDLAAYVDLVAVSRIAEASRLLERIAADAPAVNAVVVGERLPSDPHAAAAAYATAAIDALGTRVVAICAIGSTEAVTAALRALRPAASLLTGDVDALDPVASSLQMSGATGAVGDAIASRLLFENRSFGNVPLLQRPCGRHTAADSGERPGRRLADDLRPDDRRRPARRRLSSRGCDRATSRRRGPAGRC